MERPSTPIPEPHFKIHVERDTLAAFDRLVASGAGAVEGDPCKSLFDRTSLDEPLDCRAQDVRVRVVMQFNCQSQEGPTAGGEIGVHALNRFGLAMNH